MSLERAISDRRRAELIDLTGQVIKVEELLRISRSKDRMKFAKSRTHIALLRIVLGHLRSLRLRMSRFHASVADGVSVFC